MDDLKTDDHKLDENDHRRLGQELDLFVMSDLVGSGLPMFTPRGTVLRDELARYSNELREKQGFAKVWTPHITKDELYKMSGHWDKFGAELFLVKSQETSDQLVLKPMNCPHHIQIYASRPRSYREMPLKFLETTTDYRDEKSGELQGLSRVRSITQDDSHAFCREDQIAGVVKELIEAAKEMYKTLDMGLKFRLSFRDDSEGYLGSKVLWSRAEQLIEDLAKDSGIEYFIGRGEAAFYGPKIDFMAEDVLGRTWQVATVQLDFVMPERFSLTYTDDQGQDSRPVMIHCALLGSVERFLAVYIEHTGGRFPVWLAPEQLRIITVNNDENTLEMANTIVNYAMSKNIRVSLDDSNESVGKKVLNAEQLKIPHKIIIGQVEVKEQKVLARLGKDYENIPRIAPADFIANIEKEITDRKDQPNLYEK